MNANRYKWSSVQGHETINFGGQEVKGQGLYLYPLGWHMLPSHANAEACLTGWPSVTPGKGLV